MDLLKFLKILNKGESNRGVFCHSKGNSYGVGNVILGEYFIIITGYKGNLTTHFENIGDLLYILNKKYTNYGNLEKIQVFVEMKLFEDFEIGSIENSVGEIIIKEKSLIEKMKSNIKVFFE